MIMEKMLLTVKRTSTTVSLVLVLVLIIFPPFFGIDNESAGMAHANLGYFPIWAKPGESDAFYGLVERGMVKEFDSDADQSTIEPGRYTAHLNKVHLAANMLLVAFANTLMLIIISIISKKKHEQI